MSAYTKVRLADVEDVAVKHGLSPQMEGRFVKYPLELEKTGLSFQRLAPNFRMPFGHRHAEQEEVYAILEGSGRMKLDDEIIDLVKNDFVRVPGPVARGIEAGPDGITFLAFGAPASATAETDAEVLQDWWTD